MNQDPRADPNLTLDTIRWLDGVCTTFEGKWRAGGRPVIEELLADSTGAEQSALLRELLALELEFRRNRGEQPDISDYACRFRGHRFIIELVFREAEGPDRCEEKPGGAPEEVGHALADICALPTIFGDYQLTQEIARGGMGVVYKARQLSLDRIVAVKMILSGQLASLAEVERFCSEAQVAAQLDHPNIVPIIEVGQRNGQRFFTMGFVEGCSLAHRLETGPLAPREAAELMLFVAEALHYAHERGVIHRDLKPANILIDADGRPHITDFGLAKRVSDESDLTITGQIIGTPSFMSPEQAAGRVKLIDKLSDVYSLGAVLYTVLTGRPPFQAANALDILKLVVEQEPVAPRHLDPTIPRDLETTALKCLEKNAAKRYESAQAVADELQRYLAGETIFARPVGMLERGYRRCRRNPLVAGLAATITVLVAAVTVSSTYSALHIRVLRDETVELKRRAEENLTHAESERGKAEQSLHYANQMTQRLADSYSLLGDRLPRTDERLLWYERANELLTSLAREGPSNGDSKTQLAASFSRLGLAHVREGRHLNATQAFDQALEILRQLCQQHPDQPQYQRELAKVSDFLGRQYRLDGRHAESMAMHQQACRIQEQLAASSSLGKIDTGRDLAVYLSDLGALQHDLNRVPDSRDSYAQARRVLEPLAASTPSNIELQYGLAVLYCDMGLRQASADFAQLLLKARQSLAGVILAHPDDSRYRFQLALVFAALSLQANDASQGLAWQSQAHHIWEDLAHDFPSDAEIQRKLVWSLRDDARFLRLVGRQPEAMTALRQALDGASAMFTKDSPEMYANFEVHTLAMLARSELQCGDSMGYRLHSQAIVDRCHQRNCYENDVLRICLLLPDGLGDFEQLLQLTTDAAAQGSRTLRKRANVGGSLYRAGHFVEASRMLKGVYESNRMAIVAGLGTPEIVRADNARVAVFLAMAQAQLNELDSAHSWLAKAQEWLDLEGSMLVIRPTSGVDHLKHALGTDPSHSISLDPEEPVIANSQSGETDVRPTTRHQTLDDKMFLADIAFEVQVLLNEAEPLVNASAR